MRVEAGLSAEYGDWHYGTVVELTKNGAVIKSDPDESTEFPIFLAPYDKIKIIGAKPDDDLRAAQQIVGDIKLEGNDIEMCGQDLASNVQNLLMNTVFEWSQHANPIKLAKCVRILYDPQRRGMLRAELEKDIPTQTVEQKDPAETGGTGNGGAETADDEIVSDDEDRDNNEPDPDSEDYPNTRVRDIDDDPCNFTVDLSCGMRVQAVEPRERKLYYGYVVRYETRGVLVQPDEGDPFVAAWDKIMIVPTRAHNKYTWVCM